MTKLLLNLMKFSRKLVTQLLIISVAIIAIVIIFSPQQRFLNSVASEKNTAQADLQSKTTSTHTSTHSLKYKSLIVAGGCFWCVESDFENIPGVIKATSGYINGFTDNPTYRQVANKKTGHFEAVKIEYDPNAVQLKTLVDYFWKTIDPTDDGGQFCDRGSPYKTGLFYQNDDQKRIFENSLADIKKNKPFPAPIVTPILQAKFFYDAEGYHQNYYAENSIRYKLYRNSCGRDKRIKKLWGDVASKKYH